MIFPSFCWAYLSVFSWKLPEVCQQMANQYGVLPFPLEFGNVRRDRPVQADSPLLDEGHQGGRGNNFADGNEGKNRVFREGRRARIGGQSSECLVENNLAPARSDEKYGLDTLFFYPFSA